jgi:hypothetical protein
MDRKTRNKVWGLVGALILCAGSAGLGQDIYLLGGGVAGDPNAPGPPDVNEPWDPATHLAAGWRSMTLSTELRNPAECEWAQTPPVRSLSFGGLIRVVDANGLVGVSETAVDALAFDETGKQLETVAPLPSSPLYRPLIYTVAWLSDGRQKVSIAPYSFSINVSMGSNAPFPLVLSRVEWSMPVLLSDRFETIDIPFAPTTGWIEMTPGLEIFVEEAVVQEQTYRYRIKVRYDRNNVTYLDARDRRAGFIGRLSEQPYLWSSQTLPEIVVTGIDVVNAEGQSVWGGSTGSRSMGTSGGFTDSGNQRTATHGGSGYCSTCGTAAFLRHVVAFKPYSRQVRFVLENVPVPSL